MLVALKPDLAFESNQEAEPGYGIKIGKGKPRGLGSIATSLTLRIDDLPENSYSALDVSLARELPDETTQRKQLEDHVCKYKQWLAPPGAKWEDLDLAKALKALLKFPDNASARVYPAPVHHVRMASGPEQS